MTRLLAAIPLVALAVTWSAVAGNAPAKLEIKRHRFAKHPESSSERLVFDFTRHGGRRAPTVRVTPNVASREMVVHVEGAALEGAIPEAAVNDSVIKRTEWMGPLTFNADTGENFSIRVGFKTAEATMNAFWLGNPARLVLDVYRSEADAKAAPKIAATGGGRKVAGRGGKGFYCFPTTAQVAGAAVADGAAPSADGASATTETGDGVVCYPMSSRISAPKPTATTAGGTPVAPYAPTEASTAGGGYGWKPGFFSADRPLVDPPSPPVAVSTAPVIEGVPVTGTSTAVASASPGTSTSATTATKPDAPSDRKRSPSSGSLLSPMK